MRPVTRRQAGASLLLSRISPGPHGLVLQHDGAVDAHVRSWAAPGLVRDRSRADRARLPGSAGRFAGLGLLLRATNAAVLTGPLAYRRHPLAW